VKTWVVCYATRSEGVIGPTFHYYLLNASTRAEANQTMRNRHPVGCIDQQGVARTDLTRLATASDIAKSKAVTNG